MRSSELFTDEVQGFVEQQGGERFFGEPMLDVQDLLQTDGNGYIVHRRRLV